MTLWLGPADIAAARREGRISNETAERWLDWYVKESAAEREAERVAAARRRANPAAGAGDAFARLFDPGHPLGPPLAEDRPARAAASAPIADDGYAEYGKMYLAAAGKPGAPPAVFDPRLAQGRSMRRSTAATSMRTAITGVAPIPTPTPTRGTRTMIIPTERQRRR